MRAQDEEVVLALLAAYRSGQDLRAVASHGPLAVLATELEWWSTRSGLEPVRVTGAGAAR